MPSLDLGFYLRHRRPVAALALDFLSGATLDPRITFTRASNATRFNASGNLETVANDVPRFDYDLGSSSLRGLLIEESRTNSLTNNTNQGAVAGVVGSGGSAPTNYGPGGGSAAGLTMTISNIQTLNGLYLFDIRFSGTTNATGFQYFFQSAIAASAGQIWTTSFWYALVGGSLTNVSACRPSTVIVGGTGSVAAGGPPTATLTRVSCSNIAAGVGTTGVRPCLDVGCTNGAAVDFTLRIGIPMEELGACALSPLLTSGGTVARAADVPVISGANFSSWYNPLQGTFVLEFIPQAPSGYSPNQYLFAVSDGGTNNRIVAFRDQSGSSIGMRCVAGGVSANPGNPSANTITGAVSKVALAYAVGASQAIGCVNGVLGTAGSPAALPTVDRLTLGCSEAANSAFLNGHMRRLTYYNTRLPNATLQALTT